jgi:outer membrane protein assembly factor BamB
MIPRAIQASGIGLLALCLLGAGASDWPQWGRDGSRNMVAPPHKTRDVPASFEPGKMLDGEETVQMPSGSKAAKSLRWVVKLGSQSYGNPTVANGRVFVGTNNASPRDPKYKGDYSMVMAFSDHTGDFLWQLAVPKLGAGKVSDWEYLGICSSPAVQGDVVYVVSSRGEVLALDVHGQANGNQGFADEAQYVAGPGKPPIAQGPHDGDILWKYDMRQDLGVFPHNVTSSSVLIMGSRLVVATSNGVDWSHKNVPAPFSPSLVVLNRKTGALVAEEASGISERLLHAGWSSPATAKIKGKPAILYGAGDGLIYAFSGKPSVDSEGLKVIRELWRVDANPKHYRTRDGAPRPYGRRDGPSEIIASPVVHKGHVCAVIGQDPEHGTGAGAVTCVRLKDGAIRWQNTSVGRSISTLAISDGVVFAADLMGFLYAIDFASGADLWKHDTGARLWSSPVVADGKVIIGNEDGTLVSLKAGREKKVLGEVTLHAPIYGSVIVAGDTLYVPTQSHLYAVRGARR